MGVQMLLLLVAVLLPGAAAHSWMTCPRSFNPSAGRGGEQTKPCEDPYWGGVPVTHVKAGDRLKVGWVSNNHAGGFARVAFVPAGRETAENFARNVLKTTCWGSSTDAAATERGECASGHPCGARGSCDYQRSSADVEKYDTTVKIPLNLVDGLYTLQTQMLVGNAGGVYNSCAKIQVTGGNPLLQCTRVGPAPAVSSCKRSSGGRPVTDLTTNTKAGGAGRGNNLLWCFDAHP